MNKKEREDTVHKSDLQKKYKRQIFSVNENGDYDDIQYPKN